MKVKFWIDRKGSTEHAEASSDVDNGDFDCIGLLLSGDLVNERRIQQFEDAVFRDKDRWWFDATRVDVESDFATIVPAFDSDSDVKIPLSTLRELVSDWRKFLKTKKEIEKSYLLK